LFDAGRTCNWTSESIMGLTDGQDVFVSISEGGINTLFQYLLKQRPRLFNYATQFFIDKPKKCCVPLGKNSITQEDPLPVPGTEGLVGLEYAIQFTNLHVDLHPQTSPLPPELSLPSQHFSFSTTVNLSIPFPDVPEDWEPMAAAGRKQPVFQLEEPFCCKLAVVLTGGVEKMTQWVPVEGIWSDFIRLTVDQLEIVDIAPDCLETILERYALLTLRHGILNMIKYRVTQLALGFIEITLSTDVSPNPAIEDDQIKLWGKVAIP
jgi:hypothetical protein